MLNDSIHGSSQIVLDGDKKRNTERSVAVISFF